MKLWKGKSKLRVNGLRLAHYALYFFPLTLLKGEDEVQKKKLEDNP